MAKTQPLRRSRSTPSRATVKITRPRARRDGSASDTARPANPLLDRAVLGALALIGLLFAAWQVAHVRGYTYVTWQGTRWDDYDEGVYLVSARALNAGYSIFSQVFSSQPPLFLGGLAVALRLAGGAAGAGHLYSLASGLLALGGVAWLCWEIGGRWPALLAAASLALSPGFVIAARAVEAEAPMLAFGSLAVAAATRYARLGDRRWLVAGALLLAAAMLSKLLAVAVAAPLAVAIVMAALASGEARVTRKLIADLGLAALCVAAPILAAFLLLSPAAQYDQVIRFHLRASAAIPASKTPNADQFQTFLGWDPGLLALVAVGMAVAALTRRRLALIPLSWLLGTVASMITYHPLFIHHLTVLLAPLAALAGLAVASEGVEGHTRRATLLLLASCGFVAYLVWLPVSLDHSAHAFVADNTLGKASYVAWLKAHSGPQDLVVVDKQTLAVAADRLVPPALTDTSIVRATSGYLPVSLLIRATSDPRVRAVLLARELAIDGRYAPYRAWLRRHFRQVRVAPHDPALAFVRRTP